GRDVGAGATQGGRHDRTAESRSAGHPSAMASSADPWRILGLAPGATQDEIRRAYRRLAKINHPDAAGEAALPRFLAIQSAYEQLAGPDRARRIGARPGSTGGSRATGGPSSEREPWRADPGRAAASGRADGRR